MPVIFVHGVTVRRERYEEALKMVRERTTALHPELQVEGFYWGNMGTPLRYRGISIPGFLEGTRAIIPAPLANRIPNLEQDELKALLLDAPYLELIALRDADEFDPAGAGFMPMPANIEKRNQLLYASRPRVVDSLRDSRSLAAAIGPVVTNDTIQSIVQNAFNQAGRTNRDYEVGDLIGPLTRCLTAALYQATVGQVDTLDIEFAWTEVESEVQRILGQEFGGQRGIISDSLKNLTLSAITVALRESWRQRIMKSMSLFIGDVLAYLAHRDSILEQFEQVVTAAIQLHSSPLWLMGHSLGGIICYDYCCQTARSVERLITVGSQVGLFGEFGILKNMTVSTDVTVQAPAQIGKWLNLYDRDDMLSFLARPVFSKAEDFEIDTHAPFPASHGEYFHRSEMYEVITRQLR